MNRLEGRIIAFILIFALATSPYCNGLTVGPVVLTPTTIALALAALVTVISRLLGGLPLVSLSVFVEPAFVSAIIYFLVGLSTYFAADDKAVFFKEVVQRTTIIWLPLYAYSQGFRRVEDAKSMFLWYLPTTAFVATVSFAAAGIGRFEQPSYVLGLHKNMTASLCATMALICVAHLLTSMRPKIKLPIIKIQINNKLLFGGLFLLALLGIIAAQGRAGILEVIAGAYMMLIGIKAKPSTLIKLAVVCLVCGAIAYKVLPEKAIEHVVSTQRHSANAIRLETWTEMGRHCLTNPFRAVGWGNVYVDDTGYVYYDLACVLLFDWMQMSIVGVIALLGMIISSVCLGVWNARHLPTHSMISFVNLAATGIIAGKFLHGMLDTFWIARGGNLHTWMAVGVCLFVRLWIKQHAGIGKQLAISSAQPKPKPSLVTARS